MNLFAASGMDMPGGGGRGQRKLPLRQPHVPLFNEKVVAKAIAAKAIDVTGEVAAKAVKYAKKARSKAFLAAKETAARNAFYKDVLQELLGFRGLNEGAYTLAFEYPLRRKPVDVALGEFGSDDDDFVHAPFEMKGPDMPDLDKIMSGRGMSPVQQAWDYAADAPNAKWVLVSNCLEIRLYGFGRGRDAYELFDLTRLDDTDELTRLLLILGARRFLGGETEALLTSSDSALKTITNELYSEYRDLRVNLVGYLTDEANGPKLLLTQAIAVAQKLLDRALFIAFASGNTMLPKNLFGDAVRQKNPYEPVPVWRHVRTVFRWIDKGHKVSDPRYDVWPYNGGLFAEDAVADTIDLPDHLSESVHGLFKWDYGKDISVNVLGHIFEHSIGHLEELRGGPAAVSQRKLGGIVYTPEHVTQFLVDQTISKTLHERFAACYELEVGNPLPSNENEIIWPKEDDEKERRVWLSYLEDLRSLTIVDPACGSGAFLVAAYDALFAEYRRVTQRLADLDAQHDFDIADEILLNNLYGVDINIESVEITRLALWLKTARRQHRLAKLDESIQAGNSLIHDAQATERPFDWHSVFPDIFANGGFDIVIGNPPYVRMEHLKDVKPWLAKNYNVADERTDLSAYFFEKGLNILKPGGRLGYISTSSFFRAGYGEKLRLMLGELLDIETVVDYGDIQIFDGVTTYPAILTGRTKTKIAEPDGQLAYLNIKTEAPKDIGRTFAEISQTMPRARLTGGSWQFEDEALAQLRIKITKGRRTLGEVYGAPLRGIVTGLNEAFIIDTVTRDQLVADDPKSADLLKPFLKGENIKRWRVESDGLWLINTPKGKIDIKDYPAVRDWLLPFKDRLEARATQQEWWELQQAQLAYQPKFEVQKISYPHFQNERMFTIEEAGAYSNDKSYLIPIGDFGLLGFLNSRLVWAFLTSISPAVRNGWHEMRVQYVENTPIPSSSGLLAKIGEVARAATKDATALLIMQNSLHHRLLTDLAAPGAKLSRKLRDFQELGFIEFRAEVKRVLKAEIPVKERGQWEELFDEAKAEVSRLSAEIEAGEREIDRLVYEAFQLTAEEIKLLENSLEGQA